MTTYNVTVSVPEAPRFGTAVLTIEATGAVFAEHIALKLVKKRWACSSPFQAVAVAA